MTSIPPSRETSSGSSRSSRAGEDGAARTVMKRRNVSEFRARGNVDPSETHCPAAVTRARTAERSLDFLNTLRSRILPVGSCWHAACCHREWIRRSSRRKHVRHAGLGAARRRPAPPLLSRSCARPAISTRSRRGDRPGDRVDRPGRSVRPGRGRTGVSHHGRARATSPVFRVDTDGRLRVAVSP